jgi:lipid A ethanolaminephosphotransferase
MAKSSVPKYPQLVDSERTKSSFRGYEIRPFLRLESLVLGVVIYLIAAANGPWWSAASAGRSWSDPSNWLFVAACFIALVGVHFALIAPFANRWVVRPLLSLIVLTSFAAAFFMRNYSVMMDPTMIQNILKTDFVEARDLMSWSLVGSVLAWSAIPLVFIWSVRIRRRPWLRAVGFRVATVAGALVLSVLSVLLVSRDITSLMRNQKELRYLVTPGNYLYGVVSDSFKDVRAVNAKRIPVGTDARLRKVATQEKPRVFVLIVGETARAANFSLLGYPRETTPELARLAVTAFSNVTSCGTSTEVSVPCMFSDIGREHYNESEIKGSEGLLNVLARAGYDVRWLDNQSGCKGVCQGEGITYKKLDASLGTGLCDAKECSDEILVRALKAELADIHGDTVVVLHMMGNHGPAYFKRYPPEFRRFLPDCATAELRTCTREQVVNAYDNAILYTDHILASLIKTLEDSTASFDTAMLYVSDHGESLGENGLYLHGLPFAFAPETQKHVPMVTWISPAFATTRGVDDRCVRAKEHEPLSHDNLFDSVLGVLDVETSVYRPARDIFETCRVDPAPPVVQAKPRAADGKSN